MWSQKLFCFMARASLKDRVPTRLRASFARLYIARANPSIDRVKTWTFESFDQNTGALDIDSIFNKHGVYKLCEPLGENSNIRQIEHTWSETKADLPAEVAVTNSWRFMDNWSESDSYLRSPNGHFGINTSALFQVHTLMPEPEPVNHSEMGPGEDGVAAGPSASASACPSTPMAPTSVASPSRVGSPLSASPDAQDALALVLGGALPNCGALVLRSACVQNSFRVLEHRSAKGGITILVDSWVKQLEVPTTLSFTSASTCLGNYRRE